MPGTITAPQPVSLTTSQGTSSANTTDQASQAGQQSSTFAPWQQQLQQLLPGMLSSFVQGGQVPTSLTAPPQEFAAANQQFTQNVAPGLVAQYGAGSPQLAQQQAYMNQNLAAQTYQQGVGNYLSGMGMLGGFATTPQGQTTAQTGQNTSQQNASGLGTTSTDVGGTILGMLLNALKGTI